MGLRRGECCMPVEGAMPVAGSTSESVGAAAKPALAPKPTGCQPGIRSAFPLPLRSWVMHEDLHVF